jgi:hypothetical protein
MGGMNNKTSREVSSAKQKSKRYHLNRNEKLYKEYLESSQQYIQSFVDWKRSKRN